mgnify:CR=1
TDKKNKLKRKPCVSIAASKIRIPNKTISSENNIMIAVKVSLNPSTTVTQVLINFVELLFKWKL